MEPIRFSCTKCQHVLRVGADKAGKKAKCPKCGTVLTIPAATAPAPAEAGAAAGKKEEPQPAPTPAKKDPFADDEDGGGSYGFRADEELSEQQKKERENIISMYEKREEGDEEEDEKRSEEKEKEEELLRQRRKQRKARLASMRKAPTDPEAWEKVRLGIMLVSIGVGIWLLNYFLHKLVLLFGLLGPSEYGFLAATELIDPERLNDVPPGDVPPLRVYRFVIGLLANGATVEASVWIFRIIAIFTLLRLVIDGVGYGMCMNVPPRSGARGVAIAALAVAAVNFLLALILILLPLMGAIPYTMVQLIAPEVALLGSNVERVEPIHVTWSWAPFWESLFAIILSTLFYAEPVLYCVFLRYCALSLKDERMEGIADALVRLGLGIAFIHMSFLLLSHSGTSEVLINLLRAIYFLGISFFLWQLIWMLLFCLNCRKRIDRIIRGV